MHVTVCLFAGSPSPYLNDAVGQATTAERVEVFVSSIPDVASVSVFSTAPVAGIPREWEQIVEPAWDGATLISRIASLVNGPDDTIVFSYLDQPFLNTELTHRLLDRHRKYFADYTFADGFPAGLGPEILRGRCLSYLRELSASMSEPVDRTTLFTAIQKDMNRFDIETELSKRDQRLLRLSLSVDTIGNLMVCQRLATGAPSGIDEWPDHAEARPADHRTVARYVSIQVVEQDVHEVAYSPYPSLRGGARDPGLTMPVNVFDDLVGQIHEHSPEAVISISLWGEVSLHPNVVALLDSVASRPPMRLVVETSGVGWSEEARRELLSRDRVDIIVGLDTNDPSLYREIRGEGFAEAVEFATHAVEMCPARVHVQAVRCDLTDPALEAFYRHWKEITPNVIIQKYDSFAGRLPNRALSDLAPVRRFPCWHLQRDLTVLVDGTVPLCREDLDQSVVLGNVVEDGFGAVWSAGERYYKDHTVGEYRGICEGCDEYYTFNF